MGDCFVGGTRFNFRPVGSSQVEVEQALVEAEMESEVAGLQQEKDTLDALHAKMSDMETKSQQEREKVSGR